MRHVTKVIVFFVMLVHSSTLEADEAHTSPHLGRPILVETPINPGRIGKDHLMFEQQSNRGGPCNEVAHEATLSGPSFSSSWKQNARIIGGYKNGPENAKVGLEVNALKANYAKSNSSFLASRSGEVDGINVTTRQGCNFRDGCDTSGILVNVQTNGASFSSTTEMVNSTLNANGSIDYAMDLQEGVLNPILGDLDGAVYTAQKGRLNDGVLVQDTGNARWMHILQALHGGKTYFSIDGKGNLSSAGSAEFTGVTTSSLDVAGSARITARAVSQEDKSHMLTVKDCGTTIRDTGTKVHIYTIPAGLPIGCSIGVFQAGSDGTSTHGIINFVGASSVMREQYGVKRHGITNGQYATAEILIDSFDTFRLNGEVE